MFLAKDIMTVTPITVHKDENLKGALDLLAKHNISGLPVVDNNDRVVGIISGTDIMQYSNQNNIIPHASKSIWISPYSGTDDLASVRSGFEILHRTAVEKIMTKKVYTITADTPVSEVARLMNRRKINRVPVVDDDEKLIGIVTRADMVKYLAELEK